MSTVSAVAAFNRKFGGLAPQSAGASKVLFLRYSDDPWQPVQPNASMGGSLPLARRSTLPSPDFVPGLPYVLRIEF